MAASAGASATTRAVLRILVKQPADDHFTLQVVAATGLPGAVVHPVLARLEHLEWLESDWEAIDPPRAGRPRRRSYRLTERGLAAAREALAVADARHGARLGIPALRPLGEPA